MVELIILLKEMLMKINLNMVKFMDINMQEGSQRKKDINPLAILILLLMVMEKSLVFLIEIKDLLLWVKELMVLIIVLDGLDS